MIECPECFAAIDDLQQKQSANERITFDVKPDKKEKSTKKYAEHMEVLEQIIR